MELHKDYTGFTGLPKDILNVLSEGKYVVRIIGSPSRGERGIIITQTGGLSFSLSDGEESTLEDYDWRLVSWDEWVYKDKILVIVDYLPLEKLIFER